MRPDPRPSALLAAALLVGGALTAAAADTPAKTRSFRHAFPAQTAELRIANLAGRIELVRAQGSQVVVDATVHAAGRNARETQELLAGMKWVRGRDRKGREVWELSYPVDDYRGFHYPRPGRQSDIPWFLEFLEFAGSSTTEYRGERVHIYRERRSGVPTLYADLKIALPARGNVVVKNAIGPVRGNGPLEGTLVVDTGSGDVQMAAYSGDLTIDTGSGNVLVGAVTGETSIDTGSGNVTVRKLVGNGLVDTGSGNVTVESISAGKLSVDTGSGNVVVRNGRAGRLLADTGSGNVHVLGVEIEELQADTGSGDVVLRSSLQDARRVVAETGSGDVEIHAGPRASFDLRSEQGSGDLEVGYADANLRRSGRKVVGARRGNGRTVIQVETGSGDCVITPRQQS